MSDLRWYPPSLIDEAALAAAVRGLPRFGRVRYSIRADSTNARAFDVLHLDDSVGISIVTESQDKGRGRGGRAWVSPAASGLLFSTILPAQMRAPTLGAVGFWAALAVADAIAIVCSVTLAMKWPNDLLLDGSKCVGILSEAKSVGPWARVVLGVGINVNRPAEIPREISSTAAWLSDRTRGAVDRTALLAQILGTYEERFDELMERPAEVVAAWAERAALHGKRATVKSNHDSVAREGIVRGVSREGALLLETETGLETITLGDVDVLG